MKGVAIAVFMAAVAQGAMGEQVARVACDGKGGWRIDLLYPQEEIRAVECTLAHEEEHIRWAQIHIPGQCLGRPSGASIFQITPEQKRDAECQAYRVQYRCLRELGDIEYAFWARHLARRRHGCLTEAW